MLFSMANAWTPLTDERHLKQQQTDFQIRTGLLLRSMNAEVDASEWAAEFGRVARDTGLEPNHVGDLVLLCGLHVCFGLHDVVIGSGCEVIMRTAMHGLSLRCSG